MVTLQPLRLESLLVEEAVLSSYTLFFQLADPIVHILRIVFLKSHNSPNTLQQSLHSLTINYVLAADDIEEMGSPKINNLKIITRKLQY